MAPANQPSDLRDDPGLEVADVLAEFELVDKQAGALQATLAPVSGKRFGPSQFRDPPDVGEHYEEVLDDRPKLDDKSDTGSGENV